MNYFGLYCISFMIIVLEHSGLFFRRKYITTTPSFTIFYPFISLGESKLAHFSRYALMEMGLDSPDLPIGVASNVHLKRCEKSPHLFSFFIHFLLSSQNVSKTKSLLQVRKYS